MTGHGGATLAYADVVLPAAVAARTRRAPSPTSRAASRALDAKIVAPGSAWPDVAIAAELAEEFGQSLGLSSVVEAARAIEETTGYPALSVLDGLERRRRRRPRRDERAAPRPGPDGLPGHPLDRDRPVSPSAPRRTTVEVDAPRDTRPPASPGTRSSAGRGVDVAHRRRLRAGASTRVGASTTAASRCRVRRRSPPSSRRRVLAPQPPRPRPPRRRRRRRGRRRAGRAARPACSVTRDDAVARGVVEVAFALARRRRPRRRALLAATPATWPPRFGLEAR